MREQLFDPRATCWYAGAMREDPITLAGVLRALELFGPQARPYNFDDCFDCWGLVRRVFDHLDDGFEMDEELRARATRRSRTGSPSQRSASSCRATCERRSSARQRRLPRRVLLWWRRRPGPGVRLVAARAGAPVRGDGGRLEARGVARHPHALRRATETTDRLRNDGGAYLRLWDRRQAFYHRTLHERLLAGGAGEGGAAGRDVAALRRTAGLSELPFYCLRGVPRDAEGREVYDNLLTRHLDYYVPDGAPALDDDYEEPLQGVEAPGTTSRPRSNTPARRRRASPRLHSGPCARDPSSWSRSTGSAPTAGRPWRPHPRHRDRRPVAAPVTGVTGCRVELWEETWDCWKHRLLRLDLDEPVTRFTVPDDLLHDDARFALVVWARGPGGFSGTALAPFLYRPARHNPLLAYDPVRPQDRRRTEAWPCPPACRRS